MGDVIALPTRGRPDQAAAPPKRAPAWDVDDWGRDDVLARAAGRLTRLRWDTACGGLEHLPPSGPGVVVVNSHRFRLTPWWVALALSAASGRPVRFVGRPDSTPFVGLARRLGGLLARPDEVAGALRHGELLVLGLSGTLDPRRVGSCDPLLVVPAVEQGAPVLPAAAAASDLWRTARIDIAPAITPRPRAPASVAAVELARAVEDAVARLLGSFGAANLSLPLGWLPSPRRDG